MDGNTVVSSVPLFYNCLVSKETSKGILKNRSIQFLFCAASDKKGMDISMYSSRKKACVYLIITFLLWGSLYVVSKSVLNKLPVFTTAFFRYLIAFITLSVILSSKKIVLPEKKDWKYFFVLGFLGYTVSVNAQLIGTKLAGASMASLINALNPVAITLAGAVILREKLTKYKTGGILVSLLGVYAILGSGSAENPAGILFSLFAVLIWSASSVLVRKISQKYDSLLITWIAIGMAVILNMPVGIGELYAKRSVINVDMSCVCGLLFMGIFCTGISYMLWNKSLSLMDAGICSSFYPLQPLTAACLGAVFFKEKITASFLLGAFFIVCGMVISLHSPDAKHRSHRQ